MKKILTILFILFSFSSYSQITIQANSATTLYTNDLLDLEALPIGGFTFSWAGPVLSSGDEYLSGIVTSADNGVYTVTATDGITTSTETILITVNASSVIDSKVLLGGCYVSGVNLMHDSLRTYGIIPLTDPYGSGLTLDPSVFLTTGNDAIVDWVKLELRSNTDWSNVLYTQSALVQRDGTIVAIDGISNVTIQLAPPGSYYLAVKHRNHLGIMTASTITTTETGVSVDFTNPGLSLYSRSSPFHNPSPLSGPTLITGGKRVLYYGNTYKGESKQRISYFRIGDRLQVLNVAGPRGNVYGYNDADVTMNGYTNFNNPLYVNSDRAAIFTVCQGSTSSIVWEQLP